MNVLSMMQTAKANRRLSDCLSFYMSLRIASTALVFIAKGFEMLGSWNKVESMSDHHHHHGFSAGSRT